MKKDKRNAILAFLVVIAAIALFTWVVLCGGKLKAKEIILGLDLRGGASITYEAQGDKVTSQQMGDVIKKLQDRVETYSTEASVYQEGEKRIVVDIPGVTDDTEIFKSLAEVGEVKFVTESNETVLTGKDIHSAEAVINQESVGASQYAVSLELTSDGKTKFATATAANKNKTISIYYNDKVISSPTVNDAITGGKAQITGSFTQDEANELASYIRIGALPVELSAIRSTTVGAQLGADALESSLIAGLIGLAIVILFMIIVYRVPGVAAAIALVLYTVLTVFLLNLLDITLTLPGIAGIILSIGMAVDANVVIFTRIKEEICAGKNVKSAITLGFEKGMSAIIDGNVTTLIAALVLGIKGSGTVKGFAYTLGLGIIVSLFTALFVTKSLVWAFYKIGLQKESMYSNRFKFPVIDFIKHKVTYFIISGVIIVIGFGCMIYSKMDSGEIFAYGLDFMGGTSMELEFKEGEVPSNKDLEKFFADEAGLVANAAPIADSNKIMVKTKDLSNDIKTKDKIESAIEKEYGIKPADIQEETISATVSGEMKESALVAVILAVIAMLIYIWFRFKKLSFALGSIIPLIHDVLIVLSIYAITQITVGNTFIACLLTILGYSINSTIVIFDRIRESNAQIKTKEDKAKLVNEAVSATLTRSINTSLTTFIMVLVLYIMGVESIKQFTLPLMSGLIAGAYSSVCIAGTIWYVLDGKFKGKKNDPNKEKMEKKIKESKDKILV